tara:strand:+ start:838 stop:2031 length:1194 start_codon:yes stop_codon:yes gene_type:complete
MTEPEKMGYPYMESIISSLMICDEVVVVLGRGEEESERKLNNIGKFFVKDKTIFYDSSLPDMLERKLKIVKTDLWPEENWGYDDMRDHFNIGLESCTGDLCMKIDADHVFRDQHALKIREIIINYAGRTHATAINLINFYRHNKVSFRSVILPKELTSCYIINKTKLKEDGMVCKISNETGSNKPEFYNHKGEEVNIKWGVIGHMAHEESHFLKKNKGVEFQNSERYHELINHFVHKLCPINYSYTFFTRENISKYWSRWHNAVNKKFNRDPEFDFNDPKESYKNFMNYYYNHKLARLVPADEKPVPEAYKGHLVQLGDQIGWFAGDPLYGMHPDATHKHNEKSSKNPTLYENEWDFVFPIASHPTTMVNKIMTMDDTVWGYDNFKDDWEKIRNGTI